MVAGTLWGGRGAWLVVRLWEWLFSAVVVSWERRLGGYVRVAAGKLERGWGGWCFRWRFGRLCVSGGWHIGRR